MNSTIHVFEKAGLGRAPFHFVGLEVRRGPYTYEVNGITTTVGAPGQPMGSCDYCGTPIANCYVLKSSDGNRFIVGSECVLKTGDAGLKKLVNKEKTKARHEREAVRIAAAQEALPKVKEALAAQPHPYSYMAEKGFTLLSFVEWMFQNAGNAGKIKAAQKVEAAVKGGK